MPGLPGSPESKRGASCPEATPRRPPASIQPARNASTGSAEPGAPAARPIRPPCTRSGGVSGPKLSVGAFQIDLEPDARNGRPGWLRRVPRDRRDGRAALEQILRRQMDDGPAVDHPSGVDGRLGGKPHRRPTKWLSWMCRSIAGFARARSASLIPLDQSGFEITRRKCAAWKRGEAVPSGRPRRRRRTQGKNGNTHARP